MHLAFEAGIVEQPDRRAAKMAEKESEEIQEVGSQPGPLTRPCRDVLSGDTFQASGPPQALVPETGRAAPCSLG